MIAFSQKKIELFRTGKIRTKSTSRPVVTPLTSFKHLRPSEVCPLLTFGPEKGKCYIDNNPSQEDWGRSLIMTDFKRSLFLVVSGNLILGGTPDTMGSSQTKTVYTLTDLPGGLSR